MKKTLFTASVAAIILAAGGVQAQTKPAASTDKVDSWASYLAPLATLGDELAAKLPSDTPQHRAELFQLLYMNISFGYWGSYYQDVDHPDLWSPFDNQVVGHMFPNPDDSYHIARLDGRGTYRLTGDRGTSLFVDFQQAAAPGQGGRGFFTTGDGPKWDQTLANLDADKDLKFEKNGEFELIISPERPAGYTGNWWKLDPRATKLTIRQVHYDWRNEIDGRLAIQRLDTPARKPVYSPAETNARLKNIANWARSWTQAALDYYQMLLKDGPVNTMRVRGRQDVGNMRDQKYIDGAFKIAPDEALIIETPVPNCLYWSFQLTDTLITTMDPMYRHSNINGFTAKVDKDGKFRAVVSLTDPGVTNWLDPADHAEGVIYGRWKRCETWPTPTLTKVKLAELRKHLPADTATVTPAEREAQVRLRTQSGQFRKRW